MDHRTVSKIYIAFMSAVLVALIVFMVIHILGGLTTGNDKLILGLYVLMLIWGGMRIWTTIKSLKNN